MSENSAELFEESLKSLDMQSGAIITGIVVDIDGDWVTVHAGLKSKGVIPVEQFYSKQGELTIKMGDEIHIALNAVEDSFGETKLPRGKAKRAKSWIVLGAAFATDEVIKGVISGKIRSGFTVDVNGIHAFLPDSLVDVRPVRDTTHLEGKELEFKVIKLDQKRNNVIVSRRSVLEAENSVEREALLESLRKSQQIKDIVKNLTNYGVLVDPGDVDGLLHITDMAWKHIKHPSEIINVGDEIDVKVLKFDHGRNRISLGLRQLGEDPWAAIKARYPENTRVMVRVTNLTDYGCFAELEESVEGLVYVSEMDWTNRNIHPSKVVQVGDEVEVQVLDIGEEHRRISLGTKQCKSSPWEDFSNQFNKGDRISGTVKSITDFGIFIGLDGGVDGLVRLSDISWNEVGKEAVCCFKKGDELETVVLLADLERERISLGIKQLENDLLSNYASLHEKGSIVRGTVEEVDAKGAVISLGGDIESILKAPGINRDHVEGVHNVLKEGEEVEAKIISVDRKSHVIGLSVKSKDVDDEKDAMKELYKQEVKSAGSTTIGDLIRAQMENQG